MMVSTIRFTVHSSTDLSTGSKQSRQQACLNGFLNILRIEGIFRNRFDNNSVHFESQLRPFILNLIIVYRENLR